MMIGLPGITLRFRCRASKLPDSGMLTETGLVLVTESGLILIQE